MVLFDGRSFNCTEICWWQCWLRSSWTLSTDQWFSFQSSCSSVSTMLFENRTSTSTSTTFSCWLRFVYSSSTLVTSYRRYQWSSTWWWCRQWMTFWKHWSIWNLHYWPSYPSLYLCGNSGRKFTQNEIMGIKKNGETNCIMYWNICTRKEDASYIRKYRKKCTPQVNSHMQNSLVNTNYDCDDIVSVGERLYWGYRPISRCEVGLPCLICASRLPSPCRRQKRRGGPTRTRRVALAGRIPRSAAKSRVSNDQAGHAETCA